MQKKVFPYETKEKKPKLLQFYADYLFFLVFVLLKVLFFEFQIGSSRVLSFEFILMNIAVLFFISVWVFVFKPLFRIGFLIGLDFLLSLILIADLVYFRYFQDFITTANLNPDNQVGAVVDSVFSFFKWSDCVFFFDFLIMAAGYKVIKHWVCSIPTMHPKRRLI